MRKYLIMLSLTTSLAGAWDAYAADSSAAIPLEVKESKDGTLTAKLLDVQKEGLSIGMDKAVLEGKVVSTKPTANSKKKLTINWDAVKFNGKEADLEQPFKSNITIKDSVKPGNKFSAQGDIADLVEALKKLSAVQQNQALMQGNSQTSAKSADNPQNPSQTGQQAGSATQPSNSFSTLPTSGTTSETSTPAPIPAIAPTITTTQPSSSAAPTTTNQTVTTTTCGYRMDKAQMVAIKQEQVSINGVAQADNTGATCTDSEVRIPLTKDYTTCTLLQNSTNPMLLDRRYTLGYIDPANGQRTLVDNGACQSDDSDTIALTATPDSCQMVYDFAGLSANQQKRVVYSLDGKTIEYKACADSEEKYTLTESVSNCPMSDYVNNTNWAAGYSVQQTKFTYTNSAGTVMTARDCQDSTDAKLKYAHSVDEAKCDYRPDFAAGKAYKQFLVAYSIDQKQVPVTECEDNPDKVYTIEKSAEGCAAVQTATTYTPTYQKFITVDGAKHALTNQCVPDVSYEIKAENCADAANLYTIDQAVGQAYRNRSTYYVDGAGNKQYLTTCVKSTAAEDTFTLKYPEGNCAVTNDDTARTSQFYAQTAITVDGQDVIIDSACKVSGNPVPYTKKEDRWTAVTTKENVALKPINNNDVTATVQNNVDQNANPDNSAIYPKGWQPFSSTPMMGHAGYMSGIYIPSASGNQYQWTFDKTGANWTWVEYTNNGNSMLGWRWDLYTKEYCRDGKVNSPLQTADGLPINEQYSDSTPTFTTTMTPTGLTGNGCKYPLSSTKTFDSSGKGTNPAYGMAQCFNLTCSVPACTKVTGKYKHTVYTRGDGSEFDDTATITDSVQVCGTGSKLINGGWDSFK